MQWLALPCIRQEPTPLPVLLYTEAVVAQGIPDLRGELVNPAGESAEEQASSHCQSAQTEVQWYLSPRQENTLERSRLKAVVIYQTLSDPHSCLSLSLSLCLLQHEYCKG